MRYWNTFTIHRLWIATANCLFSHFYATLKEKPNEIDGRVRMEQILRVVGKRAVVSCWHFGFKPKLAEYFTSLHIFTWETSLLVYGNTCAIKSKHLKLFHHFLGVQQHFEGLWVDWKVKILHWKIILVDDENWLHILCKGKIQRLFTQNLEHISE